MINKHQAVATLVRAGIDPARISVRGEPLARASHPGLRAPTAREMAAIRRIVPTAVPVRPGDAGVVGASADPSFAHVFPGWNVWSVNQVKDLPFSIMMLGIDDDRQLRIWVEDQVRLHAPGAILADKLDLKGSMVDKLPALPAGLKISQKKEDVPGPPMLTDGESATRTVRFFNRGDAANLPWPHDESYSLDRTYVPSPDSPATSGPGPATIMERTVTEPARDAARVLAWTAGFAVVGLLGYGLISTRRRSS